MLNLPDMPSPPDMPNALAGEVRLSAVRRLAEAGGVVCGQFNDVDPLPPP
ncbi:hypothetical protein AB0G15_36285 [Streptosporangium sp. NPDC023825]